MGKKTPIDYDLSMQQMSRNVLTAINSNQEVLSRDALQKDCLEHTINPSLSGRQNITYLQQQQPRALQYTSKPSLDWLINTNTFHNFWQNKENNLPLLSNTATKCLVECDGLKPLSSNVTWFEALWCLL